MKLISVLAMTACCLQSAFAAGTNLYLSVQTSGSGQFFTKTAMGDKAPAGSIEIANFNWSGTSTVASNQGSTAGSSPGQMQMAAVTFTRTADQNSPLIFAAQAKGQRFATVLITVVTTSGTSGGTYISSTYKLSNTFFTGISQNLASFGNTDEDFTIAFNSFEYTFNPVDNSGKPGISVNRGWNFAKGTDCTGNC